jgi:hypothetical protein
MRAGFYNIRGFGQLGRRLQIMEFIRDEHLDFVGLQETKKSSFSEADLHSIDPGRRFAWQALPSSGCSGGMLLGVNEDSFEVKEWSWGAFYLSASVLQLDTDARRSIVMVYGPTDHHHL